MVLACQCLALQFFKNGQKRYFHYFSKTWSDGKFLNPDIVQFITWTGFYRLQANYHLLCTSSGILIIFFIKFFKEPDLGYHAVHLAAFRMAHLMYYVSLPSLLQINVEHSKPKKYKKTHCIPSIEICFAVTYPCILVRLKIYFISLTRTIKN